MGRDVAEPGARGRDALAGHTVRAARRGAADEAFGVGRTRQGRGQAAARLRQAAGRGECASTPKPGAQFPKPGGPSLTETVQSAAVGTIFDHTEHDPALFAQPSGWGSLNAQPPRVNALGESFRLFARHAEIFPFPGGSGTIRASPTRDLKNGKLAVEPCNESGTSEHSPQWKIGPDNTEPRPPWRF